MKTNSISNSSAFALILTIFIALISVTNFSCNKMDVVKVTNIEIENRFFNITTQSPDVLKKVVSALKKQNEIGHFIPEFAKNEGFAYWDNQL